MGYIASCCLADLHERGLEQTERMQARLDETDALTRPYAGRRPLGMLMPLRYSLVAAPSLRQSLSSPLPLCTRFQRNALLPHKLSCVRYIVLVFDRRSARRFATGSRSHHVISASQTGIPRRVSTRIVTRIRFQRHGERLNRESSAPLHTTPRRP